MVVMKKDMDGMEGIDDELMILMDATQTMTAAELKPEVEPNLSN